MGMKFTQLPADAFKKIQLNAGVLATTFEPSTGTIQAENLIGATSGGMAFTATPSYTDFGEDIDNCPTNTKELKQIDMWEVTMSGTLVTMDTKAARIVTGPADIDDSDQTKIVPRNYVEQGDFTDIWWIGDYSDVNVDGESNGEAGFMAIKLINALSSGGFQLQSGNKAKGQFAFEFTGHYSMANIDTVPFEIYISAGTADTE